MVQVERFIHLSEVSWRIPIEVLVGEEDGVSGVSGTTAQPLKALYVFKKIIAAYVLSTVLPKTEVFASVCHSELACPVL